jgi:hypothetical protein
MRWLVVLAVLVAASPAFARSERTLAYPRDQAWPAAVRFIRVDENLKITDKDADAGYVMFELREDNKTFRGSIEVIDAKDEGRPAVRVVITLDDRPAWREIEMLDAFTKKLRDELGEPPPPPPPPPPPKKEDPAPPKKDAPPPDDDGPPISDTP